MKIYKILSICFLVLLSSCNDFLNQEPDVQISINEQLSTKKRSSRSFKWNLQRHIEEIQSDRSLVYADLQSGNLTFTPTVNTKIITVPSIFENSYSFNDDEQGSDYEKYYKDFYAIINQANVILERLETYTFLSVDEQNELQAELLASRAFAHYQVSLLYAQNYNFTPNASHLGIVIVYSTNPLKIGEDFPARKTMNETYELLKNDLDIALSLFTEINFFSIQKYAFFNKVTTKALYARIALQMNDWEQAFNYANQVIITSGIVLTSKENYVSEWEKEEDPISEIILEFNAPRDTDGSVSSHISNFFKYESPTNYGNYVASGDLLELYKTEDIRLNMFIKKNLATNISGVEIKQPYSFTKKFQNDASATYIRLSEMYLIRAEAMQEPIKKMKL